MPLETWTIDTVHSSINLRVRHMVIAKVRGRFTAWSGTLTFDDQDFNTATAEVHIDARSIDTHESRRDDHLRSPEFLDVDAYPEIVFRSTRAVPTGEKRLLLEGDLEVRGMTHPVALRVDYLGRVTDLAGRERIAFEASATLDRRDYDMTWNKSLETGGLLVGDLVEVAIEIEAVKVGTE